LPKRFQKTKNDLIYYSARVLIFFLDLLPYGLLKRLGRAFGSLVYWLAAGERRKTLRHLGMALGRGTNEAQRRRIAATVWRNVGENLFQVIRWRDWPKEKIAAQVARANGMEAVKKAVARGKGLIAVTAHLGNWELLACYFAREFSGKVTVVARQVYDPRFDRMVTRMRERQGYQVVQRGVALRGILKALQQNHVVGVLCDQDTGRDGVFVPFFGKAAWTQSGPARIARKTGAALMPIFITRGKDGLFEVNVGKEIQVPRTGDAERDVLETTRRYTEAIEAQVRAHPDQWVWMHERWKTRPENEKS
jgi:Kdo2-lipid IVA lauroyltransferase/acyltransferase